MRGPYKTKKCQEMIDEADRDGDGEVNEEEPFSDVIFYSQRKGCTEKTYLHDSLTVTKVMSSGGEIWLKPPIINVQTHFEVLLSFSQIHGT